MFGGEVVEALGSYVWVLVLSPLIAAFLVGMAAFVRHGALKPAVRTPFMLGLAAWAVAIILEAIVPIVAKYRPQELLLLLEETLEFSGALLFGLSAIRALGSSRIGHSQPPRQVAANGGLGHAPLLGSIAAVAVLGSLAVAFAFRVPLIDMEATSHFDTFEVRLRSQESMVQEVRMPADPIGRIDLRMVLHDPSGRAGMAAVRITDLDNPERLLAVGSVEAPTGDGVRWRSIDLLPPVDEPEGQRLAVSVIADIEPEAELRLRATATNQYAAGRLWINGVLADPRFDLEFAVLGAAEPTASKAAAIWRPLMSDWRFSVLLALAAVGLTLIVFIPTVLVTAAFQQSPTREVEADGHSLCEPPISPAAK